MGFILKPNYYSKANWNLLVGKVERKLNLWCNKCISRARRLVLVKAMLEDIPILWISLTSVHEKTLEQVRKISFIFLWVGGKDFR